MRSREDGEYQLADAIAGDVAAEVDHVQADAALLQLPEYVQRIEGGTEHAVELGGDHHVAGCNPASSAAPSGLQRADMHADDPTALARQSAQRLT
jgi:hypothetical protein